MGAELGTTIDVNFGEQRVMLEKEDSWAWKDKGTTMFTVNPRAKSLKKTFRGLRESSMVIFGG